jgi:hypothetical protein
MWKFPPLNDDVTIYFINTEELKTSPVCTLTFGAFNFNIIIDTESEISVSSEERTQLSSTRIGGTRDISVCM